MPDYSRLNPISTNVYSPTDVAIDVSENVYIVESSRHRLLKFSQSGQYQNTKSDLNRPISVAVDENIRIYIGNKDSGNVEVYNSGYELLFKLGSGDGEFSQPNDIEIGDTGKVYVVDKEEDVVKVYNADGTYSSTIGSSGNGDGQFHKPTSTAIDRAAGELIVLDRQLTPDTYGSLIEGARIQVFDMNGVFKRSFSRYGNLVGQMFRPQHVTVDRESRLYVTDSFHNVVIVYDSSGTYLGDVYDIDHPVRTPMGLVIGNSNRLFIASLLTGKVEIYGIVPYINMQLVPQSLNFQGYQYNNNPSSKNVEIRNIGTRILHWTATTDDSWITLSDIAGSLDISGVFNLEIGINLAGLSPNIYTGTVNVRDDSGAAEDITVILNVLSNPLIANPGGVYSAIEGQSILLNASNSSGGLVRFQWDINYDGISDSYEYDNSSPTQNHVYASQGTYTIKLRVTNHGNYTDDAITSAEISDSLPSAEFEGNPVNGPGPLTVNFINTSTGYDQPFSYTWDFDDDGTVDSTEQNPVHSYSNSGTYSVTLTVIDSDGSITKLKRPYYVMVSSETCLDLPVRIAGAIPEYFNSILEAYNAAAEGDTIQIRTLVLPENPELNLNKTLTLEGGYDCGSSTGNTTINGNITIIRGTVTIGNITLN